MYHDFHVYIDLRWEDYISNEDSYFQEIYKIVELAHQHKTSVFFSGKQVDEFISNCLDLDLNFTKSLGNKLDVLFENVNRLQDCYFMFEINFIGEQSTLKSISNYAIRAISKNSQVGVLSLCEVSKIKNVLLIKSNDEFECVTFKFINDKRKLLDWLQKLSVRKFNISEKHGENGKGNWPGESVLLCNRDRAQQLLESAIPDFRLKDERLFNFDEVNNTYIEFFYEGNNPQKQWHGFHVKKEKWNMRIPETVRKYYGKYM